MLVLQGGKTNMVQHGPVNAPNIPAGALLVYESGTRGRIWNISISVLFFFPDHLSLSQPSPACVCGQEVSTPPPLSVHLHRMRRRRKQWVTTWSKEQSIKPPTRHEIIIPHRKPGVPDGLRSQETGDWWLDKWRELRKPFICFCFWRSLFTHRSWAVVPPSQSKVSECLMTWRDVFQSV